MNATAARKIAGTTATATYVGRDNYRLSTADGTVLGTVHAERASSSKVYGYSIPVVGIIGGSLAEAVAYLTRNA